jgi:hypothetical protein
MENAYSLVCNMRKVHTRPTSASDFLLATYREQLIFFIAYFHVLGLFMAKKHDLSETQFSVCHAPLPLNAKFVPRLQPRP